MLKTGAIVEKYIKLPLLLIFLFMLLCGCQSDKSKEIEHSSAGSNALDGNDYLPKDNKTDEDSAISNTEDEHSTGVSNNADYEVYFREHSISSTDDSQLLVFVPHIEFEKNEESDLEIKINSILREASTSWITDEIVKTYENDLSFDVFLNTKNFLSVGMAYCSKEESTKYSYYIYDYITIDMRSGERIYLDDILNIEELCDFLIKEKEYSASRGAFSLDQEEADEAIRDRLNNDCKASVMDILQDCCKEQKEFGSRFSHPYKLPCLEERPNFYLQNSQLVIELDEWHTKVVIKYKDVDNILNEDFKQRNK